MWHSLPDGAAPPLGASARLWLSKARRKSVHCEGMPTSHCICSPGIRFQLAFELGKQKALRQRGRRDELSLPSAPHGLPGAAQLVISVAVGVKGVPASWGCGPSLQSSCGGFPKGEGSGSKACLTELRATAWKRHTRTHTEKQSKATFFPRNVVS